MLGRKKGEPQVPDEFVDVVARKLLERYGDEIAGMINTKVSQQIEPFLKRIEDLEGDVKRLKTVSDEKTKDLLRTTLEVGMESIAEKSAKKAVEIIGFDKLEAMEDTLRATKEYLIELSEAVETANKIITKINDTVNRLSESVSKLEKSVKNTSETLTKVLDEFNEKVREAADEAVENIRRNVVVDKDMIVSAVERVLSKSVEKRFSEMEKDVMAISSKLDTLSKSVSELQGVKVEVAKLFGKIEELKNLIREGGYAVSSTSEEEELEKKFEEVKAEQEEGVIPAGGNEIIWK